MESAEVAAGVGLRRLGFLVWGRIAATGRRRGKGGGRVVLGIGAGFLWDQIVTLGVPRLSPGAAVNALEEAITLVRALSAGGDRVTFHGDVYQVTDVAPAEV